MLQAVLPEDWAGLVLAVLACGLALWVGQMAYNTMAHPLRAVPGPWFAAASPLWVAWQRWHGRLSLEADALLTRYGPLVRISPNMVLLNDGPAVNAIFSRKDLATAPTAIRALRVGGHDWTVTYPDHGVAKERRHPVMLATTTKNLRHWRPTFAANAAALVRDLGAASAAGARPADLVERLRVCTLRNAEVVLAGPGVALDAAPFPAVVGAYNFLVVWRLCLPAALFAWLEYGPSAAARFRLRSSARLFRMGAELCAQAARAAAARAEKRHAGAGDAEEEEPPSVYRLFTDRNLPPMGPRALDWADDAALGAEMAGQVLAATETTSSALTFIVYELVKQPALLARLRAELDAALSPPAGNGGDDEADRLAALPFLDACLKEGLRFRPPVALTGSRVVPAGGLDVLGHHLPAGTVVATQALSMSRQRPDLFPHADAYDPTRWLMPAVDDAADAADAAQKKAEAEDILRQRRALLVPFGVGARRCPGGNMALDQMRLLLAALVRHFYIALAPQTTPAAMAPFEANGYRSRHDACHLIFTPREKAVL